MPVIARRNLAPRMQNYRRRRGFGYTPENCSPMDVACVQRNTAASIANQDSIIASQISDPTARAAYFARSAAADASNPDLNTFRSNLTPTEQTQLAPYGSVGTAHAPATVGQFVDIATLPPPSSVFGAPAISRGAVVAPAAGVPAASLPVVTPGVVASNGSTASTGFSFSSIPWWAWAGAAAVGLYAMKGKG
jgi:hypothetical protein